MSSEEPFFSMNVSTVKKGKTTEKHMYNSRQGKYAKRGDLVGRGEINMPSGVSSREFFGALDVYERKNGGATEIKFAIPRVLPPPARTELARSVANHLAGASPATWAVHNPKAALEGGDQPHVHLLICRRVPDGLARPLEQVFRRFNGKDPQRGGWRKDSGGTTRGAVKDRLIADRASVSAIINKALEDHGAPGRVTHLSHKDRGLEQIPGKHLGPSRVRAILKARRGRDDSTSV